MSWPWPVLVSPELDQDIDKESDRPSSNPKEGYSCHDQRPQSGEYAAVGSLTVDSASPEKLQLHVLGSHKKLVRIPLVTSSDDVQSVGDLIRGYRIPGDPWEGGKSLETEDYVRRDLGKDNAANPCKDFCQKLCYSAR